MKDKEEKKYGGWTKATPENEPKVKAVEEVPGRDTKGTAAYKAGKQALEDGIPYAEGLAKQSESVRDAWAAGYRGMK